MIRYAKLNIEPAISRLQEETALYSGINWLPHFNKHDYEGGWEVLALRSPGGSTENIIPDLINATTFNDTALMENFPSVRELIKRFECPVMSVRLLNLKSKGLIKQHRDMDLCFEKGEARIHFPVFTNPDVIFMVDNERVEMRAGECWYINTNRLHSVWNQGSTDRVHLVIDCEVNEWLKKIFDVADKHLIEERKNDLELDQIIKELRLQNTETSNKLADTLQAQTGV